MRSAEYYDAYAERQVSVGINDRHRAIQRWLRRFGLKPGMDVLEIGCGVGTQTELIADLLKGTGSVLALDLSPKSVETARRRLVGRQNVRFLTGDVLETELDRTFDVIVLPDVLEHIPVEHHTTLFANVRRWLRDTGWVLIHMPNPIYLEWCRRNRPDLLQLVDQPIHVETLMAGIQPNRLYIDYLNTYSIWVPEGDYQAVILRPRLETYSFRVPQGSSEMRVQVSPMRRVFGAVYRLARKRRWGSGLT